MRPRLPESGPSEGSGCRRDVFLIDRRRYELRTVKPDDRLAVIAVSPECMERFVWTSGNVRVVAKEATAEPILGIDRMRRNDARRTGCEISYNVI